MDRGGQPPHKLYTIMKYQTLSSLLQELPEHFNTRKEAESRAEYLRIGTFKNSRVEKTDRGYTVYKVR